MTTCEYIGWDDWIRTSDLSIIGRTLSPAELHPNKPAGTHVSSRMQSSIATHLFKWVSPTLCNWIQLWWRPRELNPIDNLRAREVRSPLLSPISTMFVYPGDGPPALVSTREDLETSL